MSRTKKKLSSPKPRPSERETKATSLVPAGTILFGQQEERKQVRPPAFIELENVNELGRLACALERAPLPIFAIKRPDQGYVLSTQLDLFAGASVFYFAHSNDAKQFLGYKTTGIGEEVALSDYPINPTMVYAPIIEILRMPPIFQKTLEERAKYSGPKFLSFQVKDLMSLVKVASYKVMFEEPPLPMFAFPSSDRSKWLVGTFTRIEEYEEASIFFYFEQNERPEQNYVGYSTMKAQALFTSKTDEHGSMYVKVVRLTDQHPLVETE